MPHLLAGLKTAATLALLGIVIGEFVTAQKGLGYLVLLAGNIDETALMLAAIALLLGAGVLLYAAVLLLEWLFVRWYAAPISTGEFLTMSRTMSLTEKVWPAASRALPNAASTGPCSVSKPRRTRALPASSAAISVPASR